MYSLAACAEMLFLDQPIQERARRLHDLGFGVEIWDWTRHDLAALERFRSAFTPLTVSTAPHGGSS
jgi:hydroxypyruvate isomerase